MKWIEDQSVTYPKGFAAAGVVASIKKSGEPDVCVLVSTVPCSAAGVFTTNLVQAACVKLNKRHLESHAPRICGLVINSGNANAVTGEQGERDALETAKKLALLLECEFGQVLVGSTGVIGVPLPLAKVTEGISQAHKVLSSSGGTAAARAIMTTDSKPKMAAAQSDRGYKWGGMAKGAGMIHPNMATLIAVVTTDALVDAEFLKIAVKEASRKSFNRISIDGDTSTNDMFLVLANGASGIEPSPEEFVAELTEISIFLAKQIVADGEGATKIVSIKVQNAASEDDAERAAKTIATSALVKTALYGNDANWGRVLAAAGRSGATFVPERVSLRFDSLLLLQNGTPVAFDEAKALAILNKPELEIVLDLAAGAANAEVWTCDFSHEYVSVNAAYRT